MFCVSQWLNFVIINFLLVSQGQQASLPPRAAIKGLVFDASCDPYRSTLNDTVNTLRSLAKAGFQEAKDAKSSFFQTFFQTDQQDMVKLVMKNIVRATNSFGPRIIIKCNEDAECVDNPDGTGAYMSRGLTGFGDFANICQHVLTGPKSLAASPDFCSVGIRNDTLAALLMHELVHFPSIANGSRTMDYFYTAGDCRILASGHIIDQHGTKLKASMNANSYVWLAEVTLRWNTLQDSTKCPPLAQAYTGPNNELRKLQGFPGETSASVNSSHSTSFSSTGPYELNSNQTTPVSSNGTVSTLPGNVSPSHVTVVNVNATLSDVLDGSSAGAPGAAVSSTSSQGG